MTPDDAGGGQRGLRAVWSAEILEAVRDEYSFDRIDERRELGGSSSLNHLLRIGANRYVVRVYRPYVTAARLDDIQRVRRRLRAEGLPCAEILATRAGRLWSMVDGRLVEVEGYVEHEASMNSWDRLAVALPVLGRIHTILQTTEVVPAGRNPTFANYLASPDGPLRTAQGTQRIRGWATSSAERQLADAADELAELVAEAEKHLIPLLPRQLVHGDFWDNNVLFHKEELVLVTDFDYMGERARIDDLALTLYFTSMEFPEAPVSDEQRLRLRRLVDAYDSGLDMPLSSEERAALPLAMARQPLWSIGGWVALLDDEASAREHALGTVSAVEWALDVMNHLEQWQAAFV
jgi:homoserine kinase type II